MKDYKMTTVNAITNYDNECHQQGYVDAINTLLKKVRELSNTDCPKGCMCVSEQDECPYLCCVGDVVEIAEQLLKRG